MIYIIFTNKLFHYLKEKVIIMRKITLLVLLFAVVGNIKAAHYEYIPLVRDGVEWGYSQQLFGKSYYRNLIQADTIVNNIAYKKFYTFKSCSETADENLAFIRESGKQVYITFNKLLMPVESLCDREYLIYDFGVKEGETITHFDWITQKSVSSTISKIDTVEIANTLRQRFWTGDKVLWIEGIGVEDGDLLRPGCSTDVRVYVWSYIYNPASAYQEDGKYLFSDTLCKEFSSYNICRNTINVEVTHTYMNKSSVTVNRYYGMQSMFKDEEYTFTPEGEYIGWIPQAQVDRFTKTNYPNFHRFIEKSSTAYQSAHMFNEGLGTRGEVDASDVVFIGNSYGKSYHKVIGSKSRSKGDTDYWKGAYTWFVSPVADDEDLLCYCGYIRDKEAVYIDFKKAANRQIALPERFVGKDFAIYESSEGVSCKWSETQGTISVVANEAGSCVIVF